MSPQVLSDEQHFSKIFKMVFVSDVSVKISTRNLLGLISFVYLRVESELLALVEDELKCD